MSSEIIQKIELHVKSVMVNPGAHSFEHANRVRAWALKIAKKEEFEDLEIVEVVALLHDIGAYSVMDMRDHGIVGSKLAKKFLEEINYFTNEQIEEIVNVIKFHNSNRQGTGKLLDIIRDADMMDGFGAIGIMRCLTSKSSKPEFNPKKVKCETWRASAKDFDKKFDEGLGVGEYIIDQLNFQISWRDNLATESAKKFAKPLIRYMENYILQLESEIK
jgi:putative nucleotidyltransferase with HDIG domain